uniref:Uncharacterized protein n=1 Tax=Plectus sambesii TaxID=2011161 RepID=A0A914WLZ0_9BILA
MATLYTGGERWGERVGLWTRRHRYCPTRRLTRASRRGLSTGRLARSRYRPRSRPVTPRASADSASWSHSCSNATPYGSARVGRGVFAHAHDRRPGEKPPTLRKCSSLGRETRHPGDDTDLPDRRRPTRPLLVPLPSAHPPDCFLCPAPPGCQCCISHHSFELYCRAAVGVHVRAYGISRAEDEPNTRPCLLFATSH